MMSFSQEEISETYKKLKSVTAEVQKAIKGKNDIIIQVMLAILARGHILLEDVPGVGKTTLAIAFSKAMSLDCRRLQFTPDVLPTDVTGYSLYNKATGNFDFHEGAIMCNLFLADEINRTSSKTQSALLEVMEEGKVTVDGQSRSVPEPFVVIATQNPVGSVGTQLLPESQLDRFIIRLSMGYPDKVSEIDILKGKKDSDPIDGIIPVVKAEEILKMQKMADSMYIHDEIYTYIENLVCATRENPNVKLGLSPRGAIALTKMAAACGFLRGRDYVLADDVAYVIHRVSAHRILLNTQARIGNMTTDRVIDDIMRSVKAPEVSR